MKYIRTKYGIFELLENGLSQTPIEVQNALITGDYNQADTIEELCDAFVMFSQNRKKGISVLQSISYARLYVKRDNRYDGHYVDKIYGAIWTDKGLIYVAKMNDKGELELL